MSRPLSHPQMTSAKQTRIGKPFRRLWHQARRAWPQRPLLRGLYYWAYVAFFCGFLFFPSSKAHNSFFYGTLLVPSLIILGHQFAIFRKSRVFSLIVVYLAYLILTNFWGVNVNLMNIAVQLKHLLYVLAFITASIVIEACYPEKSDRLLVVLAWVATCAFLLSILWWYDTHAFPTERLSDMLGRMRNPILAGCIAGLACLAFYENLLLHNNVYRHIIVGSAFTLNLVFIILSQSRTALAALVPALLILAIPHFRRHAPMIVVVGAIAAVLGFTLQDTLIAGINRNSYRLDIWRATLDNATAHLWWGQGYFCDTLALKIDGLDMQHAHNAYLATLRDGGLIGFALLFGVVAAAVQRAWRQAQASQRYLNLALIGYGALAVFFDNDRLVDNPEELWVFFWYPLCRIIAQDLVRDGLLGKPLPHRDDLQYHPRG